MRVDPEYHGQGFGSMLYHELEQCARSDGYETFVLDTGVENDVARGFYESHSFRLQQESLLSFGTITLELALYQKSIVG